MIIWKNICDQCGKVAEVESGATPDGWFFIHTRIDSETRESMRVHEFCPDCLEVGIVAAAKYAAQKTTNYTVIELKK